MPAPEPPATAPRIWEVGALCRAVADFLDARFNPVAVRGEVSGFTRAASGHCYFTLKDAGGQLRCAMFRRAAGLLDFVPRDGELVEALGRLGVYEARGELQMVVESLRQAGQGALFERFLRLKARLASDGLFDDGRKRVVTPHPRAIGLVTSPGAAAFQDVLTALRRRAPHVPVVLAPASVQGSQAPQELVAALESLYARAGSMQLDAILLVRGGGSLEDLWAFNDEQLARAIVRSPVPLVAGIGHETDFTIADFCADLRAPTPTAAAELVALPLEQAASALESLQRRLGRQVRRRLDETSQRCDRVALQLGRPGTRLAREHARLAEASHRLRFALHGRLHRGHSMWEAASSSFANAVAARLGAGERLLDRLAIRLAALDPKLVLQRGYALLEDAQGHAVTSVHQLSANQPVKATLADGEVDLRVIPGRVHRP